MIRFFCPLCHNKLKAPEERAGAAITCPRCNELSVVPMSDPASVRSGRGGAMARSAMTAGSERSRDEGGGHLGWVATPGAAMKLWRCLVVLVTAAGVLSLLLAILAPAMHFTEATTASVRWQATFVVPSCLAVLFALLHAQWTSCPACGKPWARTEGETESLGREEVQKGGVSWVRAKRRTSYACKHCRHTWAADYTDEYKGTLRVRPRPTEE